MSVTLTTGVVAGTWLAEDGTAAAPSYAFSSATGTGLWRNVASTGLDFQWAGSFLARIDSSGNITSAGGLFLSGNQDAQLWRDSVDTIAQRRGTNAQAFRLYNTFTDASNFSRINFGIASNVLTITDQTAGTGNGSSMAMTIGPTSSNHLNFQTGGAPKFLVSGTTGSFLASVDNANDIGAAGANRPRNLFIAGTITVGNTATGTVAYAIAKSAVAVSAPADTTEDTLATITIPANAMGANGLIRVTTKWTNTNNANTKTLRVRWGGGAGTDALSRATSTTTDTLATSYIQNRNATNSQLLNGSVVDTAGAIVTLKSTAAVDTTASTTIVITGQKAVAGDTLTLESYLVEVIPN